MFVTSPRRGQSTVELALTLPVLLLLVLGIVDFGRVFLADNAITHAGTTAARYAGLLGTGLDEPGRESVRQSLLAEAGRGSASVTDANIDIIYRDSAGQPTACYLDGSPVSTSPATGTCPPSTSSRIGTALQPGDLVEVRVHLPWSAETTLIQNLMPAGFTITSSSAATVEQ